MLVQERTTRPWFDQEIDNPPDSSIFSSHQNGQKGMYFLDDENLINPNYEPKKKGFIRVSPSDLELQDRILTMSDFNISRPDIVKLAPSTDMLLGSLRGYIGHFIDRYFICLERHYLTNMDATSQTIPSVSAPQTLFEDNNLNIILRTVLPPDISYRLQDIPTIVEEIWMLWKGLQVFRKGSKAKQGWEWNATTVAKLWRTREIGDFAQKVIKIHRTLIERYLNEEILENKPCRLPLETQPTGEFFNELGITHLLEFPNGGSKVQLQLSADYVLRRPGQIIIIDNKFGTEEDSITKRLQRLIYSMSVEQYLNQRKERKRNFYGNFNNLNPSKVEFLYRNFETNSNTPSYAYQYGNILQSEANDLIEELSNRMEHWRANYRQMREIKRMVAEALTMPHLPKNLIEKPYQRRLI